MDRESDRGGVDAPLASQGLTILFHVEKHPFDKEYAASQRSSFSEGEEQVTERRNGFLSEFLGDAGEILRDIGDVALYYVSGKVLIRFFCLVLR